MKAYLVTEEVLVAVVNFIGAELSYIKAKPLIDALKGSKTVEVTTTPAPAPEVLEPPMTPVEVPELEHKKAGKT